MTNWEDTSGAGTFPRCKRCKQIVLRGSMRDPCLAGLDDPTIVSTCCGHARPDLATICFSDRETLHGQAALDWFAEHDWGQFGSIDQRARNTA